MLKVLIIVFISIFAVIDIIAIIGPAVRKYLDKKNKLKRRKAFAEKMKELEIK